jgi:hypothetical protein
MTAHFPARPQLTSILGELDYKNVVIFRDPRDTAVSAAFFITGLKRHFLHERFNRDLKTMEDRIMAAITGLPPDATGRRLPSIARRVARYKSWLYEPDTYICRFENLVGIHGGGSEEQQRNEIKGIARHIGRELVPGQMDTVIAKTWSRTSATFRKGAIGDWRNHFTEEHKAAFKEVAGRELMELGYEHDLNW